MRKKILLADNSPVVHHDVETALRGTGIEIISTERGDRVMELLRDLRPDLLLADVHLPGKSGYELCALVRRQPTFADLPVVLLTGVYEDFDSIRATEAGATTVISKPFRSEFLAEKLRGLLGIPADSAAEPVASSLPAANANEVPWDLAFDNESEDSKPSGPTAYEEPPGKRTEAELWSLTDLNLDLILDDDRPEPAQRSEEIGEELLLASERPTDPLSPPLMAGSETEVEGQAIFDQLEAEPAVVPEQPAPTRLESQDQGVIIARPVAEFGVPEESVEELDGSTETPDAAAATMPGAAERTEEEIWFQPRSEASEPAVPLAAEPSSEARANLEDEFFEEEYLFEEAGREAVAPRRSPVELAGPAEPAFTESAFESGEVALPFESEAVDEQKVELDLHQPQVAAEWDATSAGGPEAYSVAELAAEPIDTSIAEPTGSFEPPPVAEPEPPQLDWPPAPAAPAATTPAPAAAPIDVEQLLRSEEFLERVAQRVVEQLSERLIENIAWEVVPDIAEREIRAAIAEITKES